MTDGHKAITAFGITVTTLEQALSLISNNPDPLRQQAQPLFEYGAVVGHKTVLVRAPSQEKARKRVVAKRWLRANGYADLISSPAT